MSENIAILLGALTAIPVVLILLVEVNMSFKETVDQWKTILGFPFRVVEATGNLPFAAVRWACRKSPTVTKCEPVMDLESAYKKKIAMIDRLQLSPDEKHDAKTAAERDYMRQIAEMNQ